MATTPKKGSRAPGKTNPEATSEAPRVHPKRWLGIPPPAFVIAVPVIAVAISAALLFQDHEWFDPFWSVRRVDNAMVLLISLGMGLVAGFLVSLLRPFRKHPEWAPLWVTAGTVAGVIAVIAGVFTTYATMRNQLRITAETLLSDEGMHLYGYEMTRPELRCLYDNYATEDWTACLDRLAKDQGLWSLAIFYVEEAWFMIDKSIDDRESWGSIYADDLRYWAEDIAKDRTGIFTYYLVASSDSVCEARNRMIKAEICVPNLCEKYDLALASLKKAGRASTVQRCVTDVEREVSILQCDPRRLVPLPGQLIEDCDNYLPPPRPAELPTEQTEP